MGWARRKEHRRSKASEKGRAECNKDKNEREQTMGGKLNGGRLRPQEIEVGQLNG